MDATECRKDVGGNFQFDQTWAGRAYQPKVQSARRMGLAFANPSPYRRCQRPLSKAMALFEISPAWFPRRVLGLHHTIVRQIAMAIAALHPCYALHQAQWALGETIGKILTKLPEARSERRHCEERKRRSNPFLFVARHGLLRFARNDVWLFENRFCACADTSCSLSSCGGGQGKGRPHRDGLSVDRVKREPSPAVKIIFSQAGENSHGTKIFEECIRQGRTRGHPCLLPRKWGECPGNPV